ncbi:sugar ABC transporter ATP-binding protein [Devosia sp. 63-57]|uniref:sugar ABC transporter ATP-binding protein n=1 Tax=Devosia sp. 63-57 TaxID=1895751 RepID=UPI0008684EA5|nr:sugar ABC transporter ATP-binding protein [Devosia sp. 63-57]ODT47858.1 MAG: sugar ABC transporter ATP-binding protein [Pelagibacterium sp. SCN 63-126]ODU86674.1 MAG: sugar ABC transporter ATP-binding protein [Pelagibacterium sp. SCN 63-17]OJX42431.1 MAG: sugar ABC transporter ATP-binding protein [Devosia sp. 63-57]
MSEAPVIEMRGISKSFPAVKALSGVSFTCRRGEVHALCGENGAGKSTLIKILSGVYRPDAGEVLIEGQPQQFRHPLAALEAGISVIYQEFSLLRERTVAQNLFLGREPRRHGLIDARAMDAETRRVLGLFGIRHGITPDTLVADLDVASQQMVEIAKALSLNAKVIVMDEPTAALNEAECEVLFALVERLRASGTAVIYITHRMREVTRLADRVTVIKDGTVAASFDHMPTPDAIVRAMVGRDIAAYYPEPAAAADIGETVLSVSNGGNSALHNIDLQLRAGEIVGFAGLQGAGRSALAMALFGANPLTTGSISLHGQEVRFGSPRDAIRAGIGLLPGDRKGEALVLMQSVRDNAMLSARSFAALLGRRDANRFTDLKGMDALLDSMKVRAPSYEQEMRFLSGGNQQKALVARWLALKPKVLIFIEPTRGIDVDAKASIYHLMRDMARAGTAIMMVSSDLPEILGASDRIVVMREGRIAGTFDRTATEAELMLAATGQAQGVAA